MNSLTIFTFGFRTLTGKVYYVRAFLRSEALKILHRHLKVKPTITIVYCKSGMTPYFEGIKTIN
jgi:hypothetical protein